MTTGEEVRAARRRGEKSGERVRVTLSPASGPTDSDPSVWALVKSGEVTLGRDDLGVQPGWRVRGRGIDLAVTSVAGDVLVCTGGEA